jgi:2-methylcitrate dehydratase PrpD
MKNDVTRQLVDFAVKTKYEDIPKETIEFSKCLILKTISGTLAGALKPSGQKMAKIIQDKGNRKDFTVIGGGFKTSLWEAIFLNAYFSHASELEDDRFDGGVSWDITVIPLMIPLAEKLGLSGKALLEAVAIGLEVHTRTSYFSAQHLGQFLVPGAVGPAVAGAKALGLGAEGTAGALGLAISGVPLSVVNLGTDGHFLESALMSLQGIMAAEMAELGLKGTPDLSTYLTEYLGKGPKKVDPEIMVRELGEHWVLREIQIKKYPCCIVLHRAIDAVVELKKTHGLSWENVDSIEIQASPGDTICDRPGAKDENDLQFSYQHTLAVAMLDGDVSLSRITKEAANDKELERLRSKVRFVIQPDWSSEFLNSTNRVVIHAKNGEKFSKERRYAHGHPKDPLTTDEFEKLYRKLTSGILTEDAIAKTTDLVLNMEKLKNINKLAGFLKGPFM